MTYFQKACVYPWLEGALVQTLDLEGDVGAGCLDPDITNIMTIMTMMMISLDDRDDVVSRPTRWSLWYWYLDVYVDHLVGGWDPILASVDCSAGGWSGPF